MRKIKTSFSLTPKTKRLIDILANKLELSKTDIVAIAVNKLFEILVNKLDMDNPTIIYVAETDENDNLDTSVEIDIEKLAAEVGKQFSANLEPMAEAITVIATELMELKKWKDKQEGISHKPINMPKVVFEFKRANNEFELENPAKEIDI